MDFETQEENDGLRASRNHYMGCNHLLFTLQ